MDGRTVVVTGADDGIGAATARTFRDAGATVVAGGRDADALETLAEADAAAAGTLSVVRTDVRDEFDVERLLETAARAGEAIDVVVPAASVRHDDPGQSPLPRASYAAFDDTLRTNARGVFATVREAVPHLAADARVIVPVRRGAKASQAARGVYPVAVAAALAVVRGFAADLDQTVGAVDVDAGTAADAAGTGEGLAADAAAAGLLWAASEVPAADLDGYVLDAADRPARDG